MTDESSETYKTLTQREYAAIHLSTPNSGTPWLDSMIQMSWIDDDRRLALAYAGNPESYQQMFTEMSHGQLVGIAMELLADTHRQRKELDAATGVVR